MISLALIGCGDIAEHGHLDAIMAHDRFDLNAVCDVNPERAALLASKAGDVPAYLDWRRLLDHERLDAVVLALPPEISPNVVIECLGRGLAVLDEKPQATTLEEGWRLASIVNESGGVYQIGFVLRYGDWVDEIARLSPALGSPMKITVEISDELYDSRDANHLTRIQSFLKNSSAMTHEGSHAVDYISRWNDSPWVRATAIAKKTQPAFAGPNSWNADIELADGSMIDLKVAWLLSEPPYSRVSIAGPAGSLTFDCLTGQGSFEVEAEGRSLALPRLRPEWRRQYDAFEKAIRHHRATVATVDDGLRALEVTAACELSARLNCTVTPDDLRRHKIDPSRVAVAVSGAAPAPG